MYIPECMVLGEGRLAHATHFSVSKLKYSHDDSTLAWRCAYGCMYACIYVSKLKYSHDDSTLAWRCVYVCVCVCMCPN